MDSFSKKRILVLLTNSYAALNVIHSGLIKPLADEFDVHIMSNLIGKKELEAINKHFDISVCLVNVDVPSENHLIKYLRLLEKWFFFHFFEIETQKVKDKQKGICYNSMAAVFLWLTKLLGINLFIIKWLRAKIIHLSGKNLSLNKLYSYKFSGIISTSPLDIRENTVVNFLRKKKIKSLASIISWDNLTSKGIINADHDYVLVWNEIMKREYHSFYSVFNIPDQQVCVTGIPRFDIYFKSLPPKYSRSEFNKRFQIRDSDKIILFTTSALIHFPNQTDIVKHLIEYVSRDSNTIIIVRCHASDNYGHYQQFNKHSCIRIWHPDNIAGKSNSSAWMPDLKILYGLAEMISYCDVCINVASTIRLEAAACGKPNINIAYDGDIKREFQNSVNRFYSYSHQLPLNKLDVDKMVFCKPQLFKALDSALSNPVGINNVKKIEELIHHSGPFAVDTTMKYIRQWLD